MYVALVSDVIKLYNHCLYEISPYFLTAIVCIDVILFEIVLNSFNKVAAFQVSPIVIFQIPNINNLLSLVALGMLGCSE